MALRWEAKRPTEVRDYQIDWSEFLGDDTIASQTTVASGIDILSDGIDDDNQHITIWVEGGVAGTIATLTNTIVTANGNIETDTIYLPIVAQEEPVSLAEAKIQCRYFADDRDADLAMCIADARAMVEERSGCILVQRQFVKQYSPVRGRISLFEAPLVSIDEVSYLDGSGASAAYVGARIDNNSFIVPALGEVWPTPYYGEQFTVTYTAGYSEIEIPNVLRRAVLLAIVPLFERRPMSEEEKCSFDSLCDYRRLVTV